MVEVILFLPRSQEPPEKLHIKSDRLISQGQDFKDMPLSVTVSDTPKCQVTAQLDKNTG